MREEPSPFEATAPSSETLDESAEQGTTIGRYHLRGKIGAGGMGVVLAAHDPELSRLVAIKRLRGTDDRGQARLIREAQAMAQLSHANVVTVHEVLRHADQVHIVMEYVDGWQLATWQQGKTWREVVSAYAQAARGLAAAHQAGLVHRDFKPSNALIDKRGVVRVTDFGLVSASGENTPDELAATAEGRGHLDIALTTTGMLLGTPAYMAPEQHLGEAVDARSDQWSFGCALYEAIYGVRPFAGDTYVQLAAAVIENRMRPEPATPRIPRRLRSAIRRMLSREPAARFPSMDDVIAELDSARPRTALVAGIALAAAGMIAGGTLFAVHSPSSGPSCDGLDAPYAAAWNPERAGELRTAFARTSPTFGATLSQHVIAALDGYGIQWTAARVSACKATARGEQSAEMLDRRMRCLDNQLLYVRALVDDLAAGRGIREVASAVDQLPAAQPCAADRMPPEVPLPADSTARADIVRANQVLATATAQRSLGKFKEAMVGATEVIAVGERTHYAPLVAEGLVLRGTLEHRLGNIEAALATYDQAATVAAQVHDDGLIAHILSMRFYVLGDPGGKPNDALASRPFVEVALERAGQPPIERAQWLHNVAVILMVSDKLDDALAAEQEALAIRRRQFRDDNTEISQSLESLGNIYQYKNDFAKAEELIKEALAIEIRIKGEAHPDILGVKTNLAVVYATRGDLDAAITAWNEIAATQHATNDPQEWITEMNIALALEQLGRWQTAEKHARAALAAAEQVAPGETRPVAMTSYIVGLALAQRGDLDGADPALDTAVRGAEHAQIIGTLVDALAHRASIGVARKDLEQARTLIAKARSAGGKYEGAALAHATGDLERATSGCKSALPHYERALSLGRDQVEPTEIDGATIALAECHSAGSGLAELRQRLEASHADADVLAHLPR
jgi:tetratricopeptide (TPR) repeat protein